MLLSKGRQVATPESRPVPRKDKSWPAMLRRWFVQCPQCAEVWLVVGARVDDRHVCKGCGHGFAIRFGNAPAGDSPPVDSAGT